MPGAKSEPCFVNCHIMTPSAPFAFLRYLLCQWIGTAGFVSSSSRILVFFVIKKRSNHGPSGVGP